TQNSGYRRRARRSEVTVTNPCEEGTVTRASLREYAARQRELYQQAPRWQKRELLNEIVPVTGIHRKAVIRLLRPPTQHATPCAHRPTPAIRRGGGGGRRHPLAGQWPHRRPSPAPLRARVARSAPPV